MRHRKLNIFLPNSNSVTVIPVPVPSGYEATGTTSAKRAPLDIDRPITVENDEVLFENYKEPVFNDTLEPEKVDFREKIEFFSFLHR